MVVGVAGGGCGYFELRICLRSLLCLSKMIDDATDVVVAIPCRSLEFMEGKMVDVVLEAIRVSENLHAVDRYKGGWTGWGF